MNPRLLACLLLVLSTNLAVATYAQTKERELPVKTSVCELLANPAAYEHKMVEATGFAAQGGREDFDLFDPACPKRPDLKLEYGRETREAIATRLIVDARYNQFENLLYHRRENRIVRATIVGRFFAAKSVTYENGYIKHGRPLLVIERVVSVDPHTSNQLDYRSLPGEPELEKAGCGFEELTQDSTIADLVQAQQRADSGDDVWAFTDPKRVGANGLAKLLTIDENSVRLKLTLRRQGQFVYEWRPKKDGDTYMVVVSRPYLLSFYAKDRNRVAWVLRAAYASSCEVDKPIRRIN